MRSLLAILLTLSIASPSWAAVSGAAASTSTSGIGSISAQTYPSTVNANDLLYLCVAYKYADTASVPVPLASHNWLTLSNNTGSGDDGASNGADVGDAAVTLFYKVAVGTEAGTTFSIATTNSNTSTAIVGRFTNATGIWDVAAAQGGDSSSGTSWSAAMNVDPGIVGGDMVGACSGRNGDAGLASVEALAQTGVTFGAMTERFDGGTSAGDDVGIVLTDHAVTSITTPSGTPTYTFTNSTANVGGTVILRVREMSAANPSITSGNDFLGVILK